jgi:hypothetical protein
MSCVLVVTLEVRPAVGVAPAGNRTLSRTPALRTRGGSSCGAVKSDGIFYLLTVAYEPTRTTTANGYERQRAHLPNW